MGFPLCTKDTKWTPVSTVAIADFPLFPLSLPPSFPIWRLRGSWGAVKDSFNCGRVAGSTPVGRHGIWAFAYCAYSFPRRELLSSDAMKEYNRARVYLDENYKSQEHFTVSHF